MREMASSNITSFVAQRALAIDATALPADVIEIAKHCFLDWISTALAGWDSPGVGQLSSYLDEEGGLAQATLLGSGRRVSISQAALLNGTAGHALDFDDAHLPSRVHPSVPLWPAILAFSEQQKLSGMDALAAFAAGIEVQVRLAAVMGESHYRKGWHNTATLGSFGATAAIGRLRGLTMPQLQNAFGIAATQVGGLRASFGTSCKPLHAGRAAANGLFAAGLAQQGFDAEPAIFDCVQGYPAVCADDIFPQGAAREPDRWHIRDVVFKYHASCYGTQAPVEAALQLGEVQFDTVAAIHVAVEDQYLSVCNIQTPETASQAKFSIRHMAALALAGRDTASAQAFSAQALADPEIAAWRDKIHVSGDIKVARAHAGIDLQLTDGTRCQAEVDASRPETDMPRQRQRLCAKSLALLESNYSRQGLEQLHARILNLHNEPDLGAWMHDFSMWRNLHCNIQQNSGS